MRQFDHPNMEGFCCPICGTKDDDPVILCPVVGTEQGGITQVIQVHVKCINLSFMPPDPISRGEAILYHTFTRAVEVVTVDEKPEVTVDKSQG